MAQSCVSRLRRGSAALRNGLSQAGYRNTEPIFQGSSVTGIRYRNKESVGNNPGDYDIALAGSDIFNAAKALGIKLRGGGVRTGPLMPWQLEQLGLQDLAEQLSAAAGRPVHFMIYQSPEAATARGASIAAASETEINAARAAAPTETAPTEGEPSIGGADTGAGASAGDVLGVVGWILLFIDAQKHGGIFSPGGCQVIVPDPSLCPASPGVPGSI